MPIIVRTRPEELAPIEKDMVVNHVTVRIKKLSRPKMVMTMWQQGAPPAAVDIGVGFSSEDLKKQYAQSNSCLHKFPRGAMLISKLLKNNWATSFSFVDPQDGNPYFVIIEIYDDADHLLGRMKVDIHDDTLLWHNIYFKVY